ncbi:phosphoenolpyruvate--protein phosphotransferase [Cohaesibacter sp. CAU 1516]|uniref:phosphoenolpyruvate--protein phosphotransferase n=1 Tax=Cohaesibacter sp. CAU 1516 TaxID=2576038 RepID=UPI0010FD9F02|nr:phosphoenolpyruvate--protein phosphotransferase [Cohaesibacter sp. CAU 1516]TLP48713.1 phosphoenolpyruvate--protein phosphotransferase [Cohaesibacter sp. CAU 1516]
MQFKESAIEIGATAATKAEAIAKVGALLVKSGNIEPGYIESMMAREEVANTFLGNGIAIPHGIPKDRELILETGVAVLQLPEGVEWNDGGLAHLVVGIAAKSDEHLTVLSNLTDVLGDPEEAARLAQTKDASEIAMRLSGGNVVKADEPTERPEDFDEGFDYTITSPHGLHARPATALIDLAKSFDANIRVRNGMKAGDAKSLIGLLKLGIDHGSTIRVSAEGPDAIKALAAIQTAFENGLEDEEEAASEASPASMGPHPVAQYQGTVIAGISASPGIAIGPLKHFQRGRIVVEEKAANDSGSEQARLDAALTAARTELSELYTDMLNKSGAGKAAIFKAQTEFLDDPEMIAEVRKLIDMGHSAGWSWQQIYQEHAASLAAMKEEILAARALDLRDVGRRLLKLLADKVEDDPDLPDSPVILIADDLTPSDTAGLDTKLVLGLCTASGGPTSHTAIIARSMDIPAVVGAGKDCLSLQDGNDIILDGSSGLLVAAPTDADHKAAAEAQHLHAAQIEAERLACYQPAIMQDGSRVEVVANIGSVDEASAAIEAGGEGVGLLRTEFQFLQRASEPNEDEQYEALCAMLKAMDGLPIIVRTLDIGGDKDVPYLRMPEEMNPFLGVRGIRLCLLQEELFRRQLRAIFRASAHGPLRLMYPMIATIDELRAAKRITEEVRIEVGAEPIEIGMMIEIPSAVMMAEELAREVDFFSIGTNDLTQYALAMDRMHPQLAKMADGLDPAVLRLIRKTVEAADAAGIWVGACGGIAGDPLGADILTGLGVKELSVSIPAIAAVKARIRSRSMAEAQSIAYQALGCHSAADVRKLG